MSDNTTPKLKASSVFDLTPEIVTEARTAENLLGKFLFSGGTLYYLVTALDFAKDIGIYFRMGELLTEIIADHIRLEYNHITSDEVFNLKRGIREEIQNPFQVLRNMIDQDQAVAGMEVRIYMEDYDMRVSYTVRDNDGKSLKK